MNIVDFITSLTTGQTVAVLCVLFSLFLLFAYLASPRRLAPTLKNAHRQEDAPRTEGNTSMLFKHPDAITGKALHAQMNEAYFDAIFAALLRSLQRAGYALSNRDVAAVPLLSGGTVNALAREVERARLEFLTLLGTDIEDDIDLQMKGGRSQAFLIKLICSCERLGWKVVPLIKEPEDECASSFSVSP